MYRFGFSSVRRSFDPTILLWPVIDGAALGPLPAAGYRITFKYKSFKGLNGVKVGTYNASTNKLVMLDLTLVCWSSTQAGN